MRVAKCELGLHHGFEIDFPNFHIACAFRFKDDPFAIAREPRVAVETWGVGDVAGFGTVDA